MAVCLIKEILESGGFFTLLYFIEGITRLVKNIILNYILDKKGIKHN
jgi:hypothetical protein